MKALSKLVVIAVVAAIISAILFKAVEIMPGEVYPWDRLTTIFAMVGILLSVAFGYLYGNESLRLQAAHTRVTEKPVIVFLNSRYTLNMGGREEWYFRNVGKGPAINLFVLKINSETRKPENVVNLYTIEARPSLEHLKHSTNTALIAAVYSDVHNTRYLTLSMDHRTFIYEEDQVEKLFRNKKIASLLNGLIDYPMIKELFDKIEY